MGWSVPASPISTQRREIKKKTSTEAAEELMEIANIDTSLFRQHDNRGPLAER